MKTSGSSDDLVRMDAGLEVFSRSEGLTADEIALSRRVVKITMILENFTYFPAGIEGMTGKLYCFATKEGQEKILEGMNHKKEGGDDKR
jgi:hypothetical protein